MQDGEKSFLCFKRRKLLYVSECRGKCEGRDKSLYSSWRTEGDGADSKPMDLLVRVKSVPIFFEKKQDPIYTGLSQNY